MKAEPESIQYKVNSDKIAASRSAFTDEEIRHAFQTFDLDKNMFIGVSEIKHVLKLIGEQASEEEIDEMIKLCDSDGSGQVAFDGFQRLFAISSAENVIVPALGSSHTSEVYSSSSIPDLMETFSRDREITPVYIRKVYRRFQQFDSERTGRVAYRDFLNVLETEDSGLIKKLFDIFDYQLFNEVEMKPFLINLIINSNNKIKVHEKVKISFALMRTTGIEDNSLRKSELAQLMKTLFLAFPNELVKQSIEIRVDGVFKLCSISNNDSDPVISFDQFMDAISATPDAVLPPCLRQSTD